MEGSSTKESLNCAGCLNNIGENDYVSALEQEWHTDCFRCSACDCLLSTWYHEKGGLLFCQQDYWARFGEPCHHCRKVMTGPVMAAGIRHYHPECFACNTCGTPIDDKEPYAVQQERLYCSPCYARSEAGARALRVVRAPAPAAKLKDTEGRCRHMSAMARAVLRAALTACIQLTCHRLDSSCGLLTLHIGDRILEINPPRPKDEPDKVPDTVIQLTIEPPETPMCNIQTDTEPSLEGDGKKERLFKRKGDGANKRVIKRRQPSSPLLCDKEKSSSMSKLLDAVEGDPEPTGVLCDLSRARSFRAEPRDVTQRVFRACDLLQGELLGSGFFGEVYKVTHRDTGEVMVLKQLYRLDEGAQRNFLKEVAVLRSLSHPNVLRFIGVLYRDKRLHLVTEYVAGGTLYNLIQDTSTELSWTERVRLARDVAGGVGYLHRMNVIHRDLNSHNCLVREDKTVIVADFGLARIVQRTASSSLERHSTLRRKRYTVVGNPYWMAPEMMNGNVYDEKVDVFSFGIILCEIIGRVSADPDFLPRRADFGLNEPLFLDKFCRSCPPPLSRVALLAAHLRPGHRYPQRAVVPGQVLPQLPAAAVPRGAAGCSPPPRSQVPTTSRCSWTSSAAAARRRCPAWRCWLLTSAPATGTHNEPLFLDKFCRSCPPPLSRVALLAAHLRPGHRYPQRAVVPGQVLPQLPAAAVPRGAAGCSPPPWPQVPTTSRCSWTSSAAAARRRCPAWRCWLLTSAPVTGTHNEPLFLDKFCRSCPPPLSRVALLAAHLRPGHRYPQRAVVPGQVLPQLPAAAVPRGAAGCSPPPRSQVPTTSRCSWTSSAAAARRRCPAWRCWLLTSAPVTGTHNEPLFLDKFCRSCPPPLSRVALLAAHLRPGHRYPQRAVVPGQVLPQLPAAAVPRGAAGCSPPPRSQVPTTSRCSWTSSAAAARRRCPAWRCWLLTSAPVTGTHNEPLFLDKFCRSCPPPLSRVALLAAHLRPAARRRCPAWRCWLLTSAPVTGTHNEPLFLDKFCRSCPPPLSRVALLAAHLRPGHRWEIVQHKLACWPTSRSTRPAEPPAPSCRGCTRCSRYPTSSLCSTSSPAGRHRAVRGRRSPQRRAAGAARGAQGTLPPHCAAPARLLADIAQYAAGGAPSAELPGLHEVLKVPYLLIVQHQLACWPTSRSTRPAEPPAPSCRGCTRCSRYPTSSLCSTSSPAGRHRAVRGRRSPQRRAAGAARGAQGTLPPHCAAPARLLADIAQYAAGGAPSAELPGLHEVLKSPSTVTITSTPSNPGRALGKCVSASHIGAPRVVTVTNLSRSHNTLHTPGYILRQRPGNIDITKVLLRPHDHHVAPGHVRIRVVTVTNLSRSHNTLHTPGYILRQRPGNIDITKVLLRPHDRATLTSPRYYSVHSDHHVAPGHVRVRVVTVTNLSRSHNTLHTPGYILRQRPGNIDITKVDDISQWLDPRPRAAGSTPAFLRNQSVEGLETRAEREPPLPFCRHHSIPDHCQADGPLNDDDSDSSDDDLEDITDWHRNVSTVGTSFKKPEKMEVDQPKNLLSGIVKKGENLLKKNSYDVTNVTLRNPDERKIPEVDCRRFNIDYLNKSPVMAVAVKNIQKETKPVEKTGFFTKKLLSPKFSRLFKPNTAEVVRSKTEMDEKEEKSRSKFFIQRPASPSNLYRGHRVRPVEDSKDKKENHILKSDLKLASLGKPMTPTFRRHALSERPDFADGRFSCRDRKPRDDKF
ncbi:uncharacterized protein LOC133529288, partial [Cydia pomonella]|uniref:uncharacterized protein LOC133529288 n=1 Tax=Cydia pomonella TaxID=82600 RepID=UPI002ADE7D63